MVTDERSKATGKFSKVKIGCIYEKRVFYRTETIDTRKPVAIFINRYLSYCSNNLLFCIVCYPFSFPGFFRRQKTLGSSPLSYFSFPLRTALLIYPWRYQASTSWFAPSQWLGESGIARLCSQRIFPVYAEEQTRWLDVVKDDILPMV